MHVNRTPWSNLINRNGHCYRHGDGNKTSRYADIEENGGSPNKDEGAIMCE